tara:strand:- start:3098 stop:3940 length:843 start_codon:yes stop_codon:yes gene_type:complete
VDRHILQDRLATLGEVNETYGETMTNHRVALVTGGSRGIGRAAALRLAADGVAVAVNYNSNPSAAQEVVDNIVQAGGRAVAIQADVSNRDAVEEMVSQITDQLGPIEILVNNAGLLISAELLDYEESDFDRMWNTNVKGVLHVTRAVIASMTEGRWGRIINISSNAAIGTAMPGTTMYAATKAAVLSLTKRFALSFGEYGVTVNAVLPGFTETDMTMSGKTSGQKRETVERVKAHSVLGRTGKPEDIANVISFLASEQSSFMTGQYLVADGGRVDYITHA